MAETVAEVADSALEYDLVDKASTHAEAGVQEYWVVNLVERTLVVFRIPEKGSYQVRSELDEHAVELVGRCRRGASSSSAVPSS